MIWRRALESLDFTGFIVTRWVQINVIITYIRAPHTTSTEHLIFPVFPRVERVVYFT